jgi:uroporphyrinogen III methyltransferase/synthase
MRGPTRKHNTSSEPDVIRRRLEGRAIVVTRARAQSEEITAGIEALGGTAIHCPTIEFMGPSDPAPLDSAINRLESFDWIVFASSNAVTFFCDRLNQRRADGVASLVGLVTCAIGPATAKALIATGVEADVIPEVATSEGALAAIVEYAGSQEALSGVRFLIPRARVAREVLPAELGRLGAQVEAVEAYQTIRPSIDSGKIIALLEEGAIDAITFTSPSTVSNFAVLVGTQDLSRLLRNCLVACIGPVTAATARQYGLQNPIEPETHTSASLIEVIASSLSNKQRT